MKKSNLHSYEMTDTRAILESYVVWRSTLNYDLLKEYIDINNKDREIKNPDYFLNKISKRNTEDDFQKLFSEIKFISTPLDTILTALKKEIRNAIIDENYPAKDFSQYDNFTKSVNGCSKTKIKFTKFISKNLFELLPPQNLTLLATSSIILDRAPNDAIKTNFSILTLQFYLPSLKADEVKEVSNKFLQHLPQLKEQIFANGKAGSLQEKLTHNIASFLKNTLGDPESGRFF